MGAEGQGDQKLCSKPLQGFKCALFKPCVRVWPVSNMLDDAPANQREAVRRALQPRVTKTFALYLKNLKYALPEPSLRMRAAGDMLDGAPAGQREAARRALQAKGIEMLADSLVSSVKRLGQTGPPAAHSADSAAGRCLGALEGGREGA